MKKKDNVNNKEGAKDESQLDSLKQNAADNPSQHKSKEGPARTETEESDLKREQKWHDAKGYSDEEGDEKEEEES